MSHASGELKLTQSGPRAFGYGISQYANQGRPRWMIGKIPAQATAKRVIASAARLIPVRHCWRKRKRTAEISVPAWPMPIQKTKLMMKEPHPTGLLIPRIPMPE